MKPSTVHIINWYIARFWGPYCDPIFLLRGDFLNHLGHRFGSPDSYFLSFDRNKLVAKSVDEKIYMLDTISFCPTGFAHTLEDACDWIEQNWIKKV